MGTRQIEGSESLRLALARDWSASPRRAGDPGLVDVAAEPFIGLRPTSALRKLGDDLGKQAGLPARRSCSRATTSSIVRELPGRGTGGRQCNLAPRADSHRGGGPRPRGLPSRSPTTGRSARDPPGTWPADRPLLPDPDLFRKHVIRTVSAGQVRPVGN